MRLAPGVAQGKGFTLDLSRNRRSSATRIQCRRPGGICPLPDLLPEEEGTFAVRGKKPTGRDESCEFLRKMASDRLSTGRKWF